MIVVSFLMYYFPFITCIHRRANMILSEILSFMHTLLECGKITNTHIYIYARLLVCFSFSTKKKREAKKTTMCRRLYCLLLLLGRASERTGRMKQRREKLGRLAAVTERKNSACLWQQQGEEKSEEEKERW